MSDLSFQHPFPNNLMRADSYFLFIFSLLLFSCEPSDEPKSDAECGSPTDCSAPQTAPCTGCPALATQLCAEGSCVERSEDQSNITANINIERHVAGDARSMVHVLVDAKTSTGLFECENHFDGSQVVDEANVLAAGYKALLGGSYHENVHLGRVPMTPIGIVLWVTDDAGGAGQVLAKGCLLDVQVDSSDVHLELIELNP